MAFIPKETLQFGSFGEQAVTLKRAKAVMNFTYNVNASVIDTVTASGGAVTANNGRARLDPGTLNGGRAKVSSKARLVYIPGTGVVIRFTAVWGTPVANNLQVVGYGDSDEGIFFGYDETVFGLSLRDGGADGWVAQTAWNLDKADGTGILPLINFDGGFGNVFQIKYQWLGYGAITYAVENPATGKFVDVHIIRYANTSANVSFRNPSEPLMAESINTDVTASAAVLFCSSAGAYSDFPDGETLGPIFSTSNNKNFGTGSVVNLFTIRSNALFVGIDNHVPSIMLCLMGSQDGNQLSEFRFIVNATLAGIPVWNPVQANQSVMSVDIAGTTVSGGQELMSRPTGGDQGFSIDLSAFLLTLSPGDTLTIAAEKIAGAAANHAASLMWRENF